jgi:hypothetical protein
MPGIIDRVSGFLRSPQGKRFVRQGQRLAKDPRTRRRLEALRARFGRR